jgi:hypothetical protein
MAMHSSHNEHGVPLAPLGCRFEAAQLLASQLNEAPKLPECHSGTNMDAPAGFMRRLRRRKEQQDRPPVRAPMRARVGCPTHLALHLKDKAVWVRMGHSNFCHWDVQPVLLTSRKSCRKSVPKTDDVITGGPCKCALAGTCDSRRRQRSSSIASQAPPLHAPADSDASALAHSLPIHTSSCFPLSQSCLLAHT